MKKKENEQNAHSPFYFCFRKNSSLGESEL